MATKGASKLTKRQREKIVDFAPTIDEAKALNNWYKAHAKKPLDEQNRMGMKRAFDTLVNQLRTQIDLAMQWTKETNAKSDIPEPDWNWRMVADHFGETDERYRVDSWKELPYNCKKAILRMK